MWNFTTKPRRFFSASATVVMAVLALILAGCTWDYSEDTKRQMALDKGASRIEVTRDTLPAGSYQVIGNVTTMVVPGPCDKGSIAQRAFQLYGSKVDTVMNFDGGNPVGNGYYDSCRGVAVHLIQTQAASPTS